MACDPESLLADAKCFLCLNEKQRDAVEIELLCQVATQGGPLNDGGSVLTGNGAPVGPSATSAAVYTDVTNGALYIWNDITAEWILIVG